mgnify:CR=1 FL=1
MNTQLSFYSNQYTGLMERDFAEHGLQFDDYSKYICGTFNEADKAKQREEQFPKDLQNAYELGQKLLKGQT